MQLPKLTLNKLLMFCTCLLPSTGCFLFEKDENFVVEVQVAADPAGTNSATGNITVKFHVLLSGDHADIDWHTGLIYFTRDGKEPTGLSNSQSLDLGAPEAQADGSQRYNGTSSIRLNSDAVLKFFALMQGDTKNNDFEFRSSIKTSTYKFAPSTASENSDETDDSTSDETDDSGTSSDSGSSSGTSTTTSSPASLSASSTSLGATEYGSSGDFTITVTNSGEQSATSLTFGSVSGHFSDQGGTCSSSLGTSASCTKVVRFTSPGSGTYTQSVTISYHNGSEDKSLSVSLSATGNAKTASVSTVYPNNGANWMDYVKWADSGSDAYNQSDTACAGSETSYATCIHGGELKKVSLTGESSCTNLSITDSLGAFYWKCVLVSGTATFFSYGLKKDKRLADLLDSSGWKSMNITATKSSIAIFESGSTTWWSNTITPLPDNSGNSDSTQTLSSSGTIYYLESSRKTAGYHIDADKIAITTLGSAILSWNSSVSTNNCELGDPSSGSPNKLCLIASKSDKHLWIEGRYDGSETTDYMISLHTVKLSLVRNILVQNAAVNDTAIFLRFANYNLVKNVKGGNVAYGVNISLADNNVVSEVYVHNTYYAVYNNQSDNATVTRVLGGNGSGDLFSSYDKDRNTYGFITVVNSSANGVDLFRGDYDTLHSVLTVNNGGMGLDGDGNLSSTSGVKVANFLFTNNATGISMANSFQGNIFTEKLIYGNNTTDCVGGTNFGITSSCSTEGSSDFTVANSTATAASSFKGKVTSTDSGNGSNTDGSESESAITDWMNFSNPFRGWGKDGSGFPSSGNRGLCSSGTCRIWDFRLSSGDTTILNKSGNGSTSNGSFTAGSSCPGAASGNKTLTDRRSSANTYLLNAMEIIGDFIGDDDGLCESNESCIYAPNWGAYQGEGDYYSQAACTFSDGTVSGVTLYAFPTNGA